MTSRGDRARLFAEAYYGLTLPRLRIPQSVRERTRRITTLIVDTPCLTDLSLTYSHTWSLHESTSEVLTDALRALVGHTGTEAHRIRLALNQPSPLSHPVELDETNGIYTTTYHRGDMFEHVSLGDVKTLLRQCDITENERERIILTAREQAHTGHVVYAVAHATSKLKRAPQAKSFSFAGLVSFSVKLYPNTELAIERLREMGFTLVYASSDSSEIVSTLAHASCLAPVSVLPVRSVSHHVPAGQPLYSELSEREKAHLVAHYPSDATLVVMHPLSVFIDLICALR